MDGDSKPAEKARPQLVAIGLVMSLVFVAAGLFFLHERGREAEIDEQYARTVAHLARQVELKLESYADAIENLGVITQISPEELQAREANTSASALESAFESSAHKRELTDALRDAADVARQRVKAQLGALAARARALGNPTNDAQRRYDNARTATEEALKAADEAATQRDALLIGTPPASKAPTRAQRSTPTRAQRSTPAGAQPEPPIETLASIEQRARDATETRKRVAALQRNVPLLPGREAGPAPAALEICRGLDLPSCLHKAERADEAATVAYAAASKTADELTLRVSTLVKAAAVHAEEAHAALTTPKRGQTNVRLEQALAATKQATADIDRAHAPWAQQRRELDTVLDTALERAAKVRDHLDRITHWIIGAAPGSYKQSLERCFVGEHDELPRMRCLFLTLMEANGMPSGDPEFVPCDDAGTTPDLDGPRFDATRRFVLFPLGTSRYCARTSIEGLLSTPSLAQIAHADVFVFGRDGAVLHTSPDATVRIDVLPGLGDEQPFTRTHVVPTLDLGKHGRRAFLQPVETRIRPWCEDDECKSSPLPEIGLVVGVLVPLDEITRASREISPVTFLLAAFVIAFAMLALPITKLWSLSPYSSFTRLELAFLASSAGVATWFSLVFAWGFVAHTRLSADLHAQLESTSKRLAEAVDAATRDAETALEKFEDDTKIHRSLVADGTLGGSCHTFGSYCPLGLERVCERSCTAAVGEVARWPGFEKRGLTDEFFERVGYVPHPELRIDWQLSWADANGLQRLKFVSGQHASVPLDLRHRGYFQRALERTCVKTQPQPRTIAEVVRSTASREVLMVVAQPTCDEIVGPTHGSGSIRGVALVGARIDELFGPETRVLPQGVSTIVIDANGKVMMHSGAGVDYGDRLLDDSNESAGLRALVDARQDGLVTIDALLRRTDVHVRHVPRLDWFVLSLAPVRMVHEPISTMIRMTLVGCTLVFGLELLLLLALPVVRAMLGAKAVDVLDRFRPHKSHRYYFDHGVAGFGITAIVIVCSIVMPPLGTLLFVFLGITLVSKALFLLHIVQLPFSTWPLLCGPERPHWFVTPILDRISPRRTRGYASPRRFSSAYALWVQGLASVLYVCPATVIAGAAFEHVVDNNERAAQDHCSAQVEAAERAARPGRPVDPQALYTSCLPNHRTPLAADGKETPFVLAGIFGETLEPWPSLVETLEILTPSWMLPPSTVGGYRFRVDDCNAVHGEQKHDRRTWCRPAAGILEFSWPHGGEPSVIASKLPRIHELGASTWKVLVFGVGFLFYIVACFALLHRSLRRLFFFDVLERPLLRAPRRTEAPKGLPPSAPARTADDAPVVITRRRHGGGRRGYARRRPKALHTARLPKISRPSEAPPPPAAGRRAHALVRPRSPKRLQDLDDDERFVLGALVNGGIATPHPKFDPTMARLVRRGLLDPDTLALRVGEVDRKFCFTRCGPVYENLLRDRSTDSQGTWNTIKTPLATSLVVLCAALEVSEPDTSAILAPTLIAALPALLRAVSTVAVLRRP